MQKKIILIIPILFILFTSKAQQFNEYEIKLVYLYQSMKYINWPDEKTNSSEHFTIGVYGPENICDLANKMLSSRKIANKPCKTIKISDVNSAKKCDAIYIIDYKKFETIQILNALKDFPILTIGDQLQDFCQSGGMINLTDKAEKYRLELCPENIIDHNLEVSTQLYPISKIIKTEEVIF